jgi:hypothetical protein
LYEHSRFWRKKKKSVNGVNDMSREFLKYHEKESNAIKGKRVFIEAAKLEKPRVFSKRTSHHKGIRITGDKAVAWIERSYVAGKNL